MIPHGGFSMNSEEIMDTTAAVTSATREEKFGRAVESKFYLFIMIATLATAIFSAVSVIYNLISAIILFVTPDKTMESIAGTRVSDLISTGFGAIMAALLEALIPVAMIFAFIYMLKLRQDKNSATPDGIRQLGYTSGVLHLYSLLMVIDNAFISFFLFIPVLRLPFSANAAADPSIFKQVFGFLDAPAIYNMFFAWMEGSKNGFVFVLFAFITALLFIGFAIVGLITFGLFKNYFKDIEISLENKNFIIEKKAPFIIPVIFASFNAVVAIFVLISGSFITALSSLAVSAITVATSLFFKNLEKENFAGAENETL